MDTFAKALDDKNTIGRIVEMLESNRSENEASDNGDQAAQLTVQPKICIEYATPADFAVKVKIPVKDIRTVTGEAEEEFSLEHEQQELPLDGKGEPEAE